MKTKLALLILACALGAPRAQFPVEDMNRHALGLGYTLAFRGADITQAAVPAHEVMHVVGLAYAPVPYVAIQAGIGIDRFTVDVHNAVSFKGDYGLSPAFGLSLYSPFFLFDMLRVTAGAHALYLDSEDDRGYRYSGLIGNPFGGLIYSPSRFIDLTVGGRVHVINGTMSAPRGGADLPFSNRETMRGYFSATVKTPYERAFMTLDADFSPATTSNWSHGPREASVGVSFGAILGGRRSKLPAAPAEKPAYFPAYSEMKDKQDEMAKELE